MPLLLLITLGVIGLPIALHLILKQEPKRVRFPAIRFLQQKQRTTQRKLKLRHILLLALRILILGLFGLALFQPKIPSVFSGVGLDFSGDQPLAVVLIVDTTPSMGYLVEKKSRLDEAVKRAVELVDRLPSTSKVAVLTTAEPFAEWQLSPADARRKLLTLTVPDGAGQPLTAMLPKAYQLFAALEAEEGSLGATEALPRLIAVFTDRTIASWQPDRAEELKAASDRLTGPKPAYLVFDLGIDKPANISVLSAEARPAIVSAGSPATLAVTIQATGVSVPNARVQAKHTGTGMLLVQDVALPADVPIPVTFSFPDLTPGVHQVEVLLPTPDNLGPDGVPGFDNIRHVTLRIGEGRRLLTIADDVADAAYWQLAHKNKGEFACDVVTPAEVKDFTGYDLVCLMSVNDPAKPGTDGRSLWDKLKPYVDRGGKLIIAPGGLEQITLEAYDPNAAAAGLMPGKLVRVQSTELLPAPKPDSTEPDRRAGISWYIGDDQALRHPLMTPFKAWKLSGRIDFLRTPRRAWRYWETEASPESVVVSYDDADKPAERRPAILEKSFPSGGKVLLLTTRLDSPWDAERKWNDYYDLDDNSFGVVFPNLLARYLAGESAEKSFDFTTGQAVRLPLPSNDIDRRKRLRLEGPSVSPDDAFPTIAPEATEFTLSPDRTRTAGHYRLKTEDGSWVEAFSLNISAEESRLAKVEAEPIEAVCGKDSLIPVGKEFDLTALLVDRSSDFPLLPWLLVALFIFFAVEGVFANRFYRRASV